MVFIGEMIVSLLKIWYGNSTVIWLKSDRKAIAGLYAFIAYGLAVCGIRRKKGNGNRTKIFNRKAPKRFRAISSLVFRAGISLQGASDTGKKRGI